MTLSLHGLHGLQSAWPAFQHDRSAGMASDRVSLGFGVLVH